MRKTFKNSLLTTSAILALFMLPAGQGFADTNEDLLKRIEQLEQQLRDIKNTLHENTTQAEKAIETATSAREVAVSAQRKASAPPAIPDTMWHLSGYADAGLLISNQTNDSFASGKFNPSFHFQFKDFVIFESELELETDDNATAVTLEYAQFDILLHDNVTLVVGKFLSPVGQFQERLHPSWINKLPSAPAGFGHGGVQPSTEVGFMARGGVPVGNMRFTYAVAVGNGPRLEGGAVELEGFSSDDNANKSVSGRFAVLPISNFEVGASFLTANMVGPDDPITDIPKNAKYRLWGVDSSWSNQKAAVRFEYLNAKLTGLGTEEAPVMGAFYPNNVSPHGGGMLTVDSSWKAWYLQGSYKLSGSSDNSFVSKLEPVVRYGEFILGGEVDLLELSEKKWDVGLNYWISPSIVSKISLAWINFVDEDRIDENVVQLQFSYGF